ncbi:MAG: serine hydrolase domain-containing protein [Acidimicrobiales bacterium]|jgi:CubicO group peptidase (beta-lactamase class C family)|nr:serine hydrolase domain-containing protein [Acidimicrobiales bacterium]MDP7258136.1 serine hydrolase domain-containing protein [Acidimicrobiales bacterium]HJO79411.1 serine hydrolase domain-containing protein [Acidimicrobiales bacterium]|tara:strand:+ start:25305 stop:26537 length:1233 start_codon:yes stop_codon:yes gene_type:complete
MTQITVTPPAEVGFDPDRLERAASFARRFVEDDLMVGTDLLVARRGRVALRSTAGFADRESGTPVAEDTLWRFYSMTKPITSVAVMQLAEAGKLRLRDPLSEFLPSFTNMEVLVGGTAESPETVPAECPIRISHLLTHTAGFTYSFIQQHTVDEIYRNSGIDVLNFSGGLETVIETLAGLPLRHQPGSRWSYSMATDVLGRVVEVVSGMPFADYLQQNILDPVGMSDTSFGVADEDIGRFAACYMPNPGTLAPVLLDAPATSTFRSPGWSSGGGGLVSSMGDYHRFCQMLLAGGMSDGGLIIGPRTLDLMMRNHLPGGVDLTEFGDPLYHEGFFDGVGFGLGFAVVGDAVAGSVHATEGECSWGGMASTVFWVDPIEEISVVFLTQLVPSGTHISLRWDLRTLVNQAIVD